MGYMFRVEGKEGATKLVFMIPSSRLIERDSCKSLGCRPPMSTASWLQSDTSTERKQASPSENAAQQFARCFLANCAIATELKPETVHPPERDTGPLLLHHAEGRYQKPDYEHLVQGQYMFLVNVAGCQSSRTRLSYGPELSASVRREAEVV